MPLKCVLLFAFTWAPKNWAHSVCLSRETSGGIPCVLRISVPLAPCLVCSRFGVSISSLLVILSLTRPLPGPHAGAGPSSLLGKPNTSGRFEVRQTTRIWWQLTHPSTVFPFWDKSSPCYSSYSWVDHVCYVSNPEACRGQEGNMLERARMDEDGGKRASGGLPGEGSSRSPPAPHRQKSLLVWRCRTLMFQEKPRLWANSWCLNIWDKVKKFESILEIK